MNYFLIMSLRRCGSTFLMCEIDSYANFFCQWEFSYWEKDYQNKSQKQVRESDFSFVEEIAWLDDESPYRGSKVTMPEFHSAEAKKIVGFARGDGIKVVHVTRPLHEQMISLYIAKQTGLWQALDSKEDAYPTYMSGSSRHGSHADGHDRPSEQTIHLSQDEVESFCSRANHIDGQIHSLKRDNPYYHVDYAGLLGSVHGVLCFINDNSFENFTKVKSQTLKKVINYSHEAAVENWAEVAPIFARYEADRKASFEFESTGSDLGARSQGGSR
jgi:hypothetical protein